MRALIIIFALLTYLSPSRAAESSKASALSLVLVSEPRLPEANAFRTELERRLSGRLVIDDMESDGQTVILLRIAGGTVMVGLIEAQIPKGEIDEMCVTAWYWRQACDATSLHRAHLVASVVDTSLDKLDANLLLTDIVASLLDSNAIASYWGTSLQSREAFLRQSAVISRELPPAWLWVNFQVSNDIDKGSSLSTHGMEDFGLREIEAKDVNRPVREVFTLLNGMAQYLISKGPVIKDGETIGDSPALNIRVRQGPSYWRERATVYLVTWPR